MQSLAALMLTVLLVPGLAPAVAQESSEALREAETAFARSVADRDLEAFAASIHEDAVFVSDRVLKGRQAIVEAWRPFFVAGGPTLHWEPAVAEVEASGRLGITRGPYRLVRTEQGRTVTVEGTFNSVWERQPDGRWLIRFDSGCHCPER